MKLEYIAQNGNVLDLWGNGSFKISNIDGLTLANIAMAETTTSNLDGSIITNERTDTRSIVIDFTIDDVDVEKVLRNILSYMKPKQSGTLRWTTDERVWEIGTRVELIEAPRMSAPPVTLQVSLKCPEPYWSDAKYIIGEIGELVSTHYFMTDKDEQLFFTEEGQSFGYISTDRARKFMNESDTAVGMIITITALGEVKNPILYNLHGQYIGLNITMQAADEIIINTSRGDKTVTMGGENIISKLMRGSTFLQMETGENAFVIVSDTETTGACYFSIAYKQKHV